MIKEVTVRYIPERDASQLGLFDARPTRDEWLEQSYEIALSIPGDEIYFSEIRRRLAHGPHHQNAYGALAGRMLKRGWKQLQEWRRTGTGNRDYKWRKPE